MEIQEWQNQKNRHLSVLTREKKTKVHFSATPAPVVLFSGAANLILLVVVCDLRSRAVMLLLLTVVARTLLFTPFCDVD